MAKRWTEVEVSPQYQQLSPQDKIGAKKQYFSEVVSSKPEFNSLVSEDKTEAKRQFFGGVLVEDLPESTFRPKNVGIETAKGTAGYVGGRAKGLLKGTGESILHLGQTVKAVGNLAAGTIQKVPTSAAGMILRKLPGAEEREEYPEAFVKSIKEDPLGFATDTALTAGAGGVAGKILKGVPKKYQAVKKGLEESQKRREEFAERINNSLIGATKKDVVYGNPGRGIAKEGITGKSFKEVKTKISEKLNTLGSQLDDVYSKNETVINNYSEALRPLINARRELMKAPADNAAAIERIENILNDVTGMSTGKVRNYNLRPAEARKFKKYVDDFADWSLEGKSDSFINKAVKKSYHTIDEILDESLPQSKLLNERVTDLISAKKAITSKMDKLKVKEVMPGSLMGMVNVPLGFLRGPRFKTGLASVLSRKYPKEFKTEVFKKPLFTGGSRSGLLTGGQQKLLPSPRTAGYKYNPPGYSTKPVKPLITPFEKSGPTIQAGRPEMSYTESKRWYKEYQTQKLGEALKKQLLAQKSTSPKTFPPSKGTDPLKYKTAEEFVRGQFDNKYVPAKNVISGLKVRKEIPNQDSISATFGNDYETLSGVREIPMSEFSKPSIPTQKVRNLAKAIQESGEINPLIIAIGKEGQPYILEGGNRFDALGLLGKKSLPAQVVLDTRGLSKSNLTSLWQQAQGNIEKGSLESRIIKREIKKK